MSSTFINNLLQQLDNLHKHPEGRLLISNGDYWAVLHSLDIPTRALCEVSTNTYLPKHALLSDEQRKAIENLSYTQRRRKRSLGKLVPISTQTHHEQCAAELNYIFDDIFLAPFEDAQLHFFPNVRSKLNNKDLLKDMKRLSKQRQHSARIALYKTLLNSSLLLLVENENDSQPLQTGTLAGFPVFTCFTDYESARCYDPRVGSLHETFAFQIFQNIWALNIGSLQINPKGDIGGDLYRNEIETLIQAINRRSN